MWHEKAARWLHFSRLPRRISSKWKWWRVPSWETTIFIIIIIISAPWRNVKDLAAWTISHQGQHIPLNGNGEKLFNWTPPRLKTCWPHGRSPLKDNHHSHHHRHHQCHHRHRHHHNRQGICRNLRWKTSWPHERSPLRDNVVSRPRPPCSGKLSGLFAMMAQS